MSVVVDCHCHVGVGHDYQQTVDQQIREMDTFGIDRAVICPVDRFIAVDNREGNDFVLEVAQMHPNRFYAFATANPWYGAKAVTELRRALDMVLEVLNSTPHCKDFYSVMIWFIQSLNWRVKRMFRFTFIPGHLHLPNRCMWLSWLSVSRM